MVPKQRANKRMVLEALADSMWITDLQGALLVSLLNSMIYGISLLKWFSVQEWMTGKFGFLQLPGNIQKGWLMLVSSKYQFLLALGKAFGSVGLRVNVASSCGWLPITNVRWLGLEHPLSPCWPLCDQKGETINHILVACLFSWQFWFELRWWSLAMNREGGQIWLERKNKHIIRNFTSSGVHGPLWSSLSSTIVGLNLPSSGRVFLWWLVV